MARKIEIEVTGDTRNLERALQGAQKSASGFQRGMETASKGALIALGALGVGAVASVKAASDLGEQMSKVSVVFRGSEKSIIAWSETTASSFGISQRAALEAAGTFGNMLVPMGIARDKAGQMSTQFVELAADMASFNNASPEETLDSLRAGLAGETEPLRRFGVFLNQARIEEEAMRMGLIKQGQELDAAAKAQATYSIILQDTADTQGDFSRTSDSLANQTRIMKAELEDTAASIGTALLPAAVAGAGALNDMLGAVKGNETAALALGGTIAGLSGAIILANASLKIYNSTLVTSLGLAKGLRVAMALTPWLAAATAAGFLIEALINQGDEANQAATFQNRLTQAVRDYETAVKGASDARDENTQAGFRAEAADLAVIRAQQQLRAVQKDNTSGVADLREAQLNLSRATEEQRLADDALIASGTKLRNEQRKQVNSAGEAQGAIEGLADFYKGRLSQASRAAKDDSGRLEAAMKRQGIEIGTTSEEAAKYADALRKAAVSAQSSNPKLAATARIAATLADAWGRVVSLPAARSFVARFSVITTVEEHRLNLPQRTGATGAQTTAGEPILVGEYRPEIFVPSTAGRIVPRVPSSTTATAGSGTRGRYVIMADGDFVSWLRSVDGDERRRTGGRGIL